MVVFPFYVRTLNGREETAKKFPSYKDPNTVPFSSTVEPWTNLGVTNTRPRTYARLQTNAIPQSSPWFTLPPQP